MLASQATIRVSSNQSTCTARQLETVFRRRPVRAETSVVATYWDQRRTTWQRTSGRGRPMGIPGDIITRGSRSLSGLFTHKPLFATEPDEVASKWSTLPEPRARLLKLLKDVLVLSRPAICTGIATSVTTASIWFGARPPPSSHPAKRTTVVFGGSAISSGFSMAPTFTTNSSNQKDSRITI